MCTCPKKIINRAAHWNPTLPKYFFVPCGQCEECQNSYRNDWFVRCYYEWKQSPIAFFYTLTFNNEHLPKVMDVPCFSKRVIQLFLKRLRKALSKVGVKVRYMICSEFGEKFFRPHHHALFFLSQEISPYRFYKLVEDCWHEGFVKYGDNMGVINSSQGIRYVTKYVTKDFSNIDFYFPIIANKVYKRYCDLQDYIYNRWHISPFASLWIDYENHKFHAKAWYVFDENDRDKLYDDSKYEVARKIAAKANACVSARLPFHLQSTKLGFSLVDSLQHDELLRNCVHILTKKGVQKFHLPRCYSRAFWYDCVENELDGKRNKFVLNELGKRDYLKRLEMSMTDAVCHFQSILLNRNLITAEICTKLSNRFECKQDLLNWIDHFDLNLRTLAIYQSVFRGRICPFKFDDCTLNDDVIRDNWLDIAYNSVYEISQYDYGRIYELYFGDDKCDVWKMLLYDCHPFFIVYEDALQILETIDCSLRDSISQSKVDSDKNARALRELINNNFSLF